MGLACNASCTSAWGWIGKTVSGLTAKLADQTFELSNAVAEPCILVDIWIIPRNDEVVLGERVDKYETCTDLILGSSIS